MTSQPTKIVLKESKRKGYEAVNTFSWCEIVGRGFPTCHVHVDDTFSMFLYSHSTYLLMSATLEGWAPGDTTADRQRMLLPKDFGDVIRDRTCFCHYLLSWINFWRLTGHAIRAYGLVGGKLH
ncbi:hypothetical protein MKW98_029773 [Papaver atlanticum]|uniref:Uncharacterized protein n=1 Tax=Papaver atlanticum TaxID=357466 RepID=A0AAD4XPF8_9MAGN|nr:hypothetical protein MKW98_029773 [Papaver atlanticum]